MGTRDSGSLTSPRTVSGEPQTLHRLGVSLPCFPFPVPHREAGDGARTRDIKLGRLALYQLSYSRNFDTLALLCSPATPTTGNTEWWG